MISVILPSRGRPHSLEACVASLLDLADDPAAVEILVAVDPDNAALYCSRRWPDQVTIWVAPERFGYLRLHEYFNHLATMASGEWLMIFNDDGLMRTYGWDTIVHAQPPMVLWPLANHAPQCALFLAWPKAWTDHTGHVALCWNADTWIEFVGKDLGLITAPGVYEIVNDRADVTGNNDDLTAQEGWRVAHADGNNRFWDADMYAARAEDVAKIREIL